MCVWVLRVGGLGGWFMCARDVADGTMSSVFIINKSTGVGFDR